MTEFRLGELYCGPGGLGKGAMEAEYKEGDTVHKIVHTWASDYDEDSCKTYTMNLCWPKPPKSPPQEVKIPKTVLHCDVSDLVIPSLESIDILGFGFPCNDFSIIGETKGMDGEFGMLYHYGVDVLNEKNPMAFVAENVSGIKGANDGMAWDKIRTDLEKAGKGYDLYIHHYYFEHYGVPQMRHRYIIVGIRKDLRWKFMHPEPTTKESPETCSEALLQPPIPENATHNIIRPLQDRVAKRLSHIKPGDNAWSEDIPHDLRLNVKGARLSNIYRRMKPDSPAYTITGSGGGGTHGYHWSENRALTNREKARIQTFKDEFIFFGGATSVRKQIGMAVPPRGAEIIFTELLKSLVLEEELPLAESIDLKLSAHDNAYGNLQNSPPRTPGGPPRHEHELELRVGNNQYRDLPKEFIAYTSDGEIFKMHRWGEAPKGKKEEGMAKLSGQKSDRRRFGKWFKERLIDNSSFIEWTEDAAEFVEILEEFGTTTLDFYKIEEGVFLMRFDPRQS